MAQPDRRDRCKEHNRSLAGTDGLCVDCLARDIQRLEEKSVAPVSQTEAVPMLLWCPSCGHRHVDKGEFATKLHHTHACQGCGMVWRPALVSTVGVQYLPGFKDEP